MGGWEDGCEFVVILGMKDSIWRHYGMNSGFTVESGISLESHTESREGSGNSGTA